MSALPLENRQFVQRSVELLVTAGLGHFIAYHIIHVPTQLKLVLILLALVFYPILRKPLSGIYLLFLCTPFIPFVRRLYYLRFGRPSVDPLIAFGDAVIVFTVIALFFVFKERHADELQGRNIRNVVLCYLIYLIVRTFFFNILPAQNALMRLRFYGPSVLLFFIGMLFGNDTALLKRLWYVTICIGMAAAVYGFKQLFFGYSEAENIWFSEISFTTLFIKGLARPFSFFQSPACFADYMLLAILGNLMAISWGESRKRFVLIGLFPFFFYAALITSVRSNWIGILLLPLLWFFLLQLRNFRNRFIMIGISALSIVLLQSFDFSMHYGSGINSLFSAVGLNQEHMSLLVTERTGAISNPFEEYSFLSRLSLWKYIIALSANPVLALMGRGVGALNADSLYITYLAELGYPGIFFITGFLGYVIVKGFALVDRSKSEPFRSLAKGITLMNIVFAIINVTGTHIHSFPGDAYFWFWNGVLLKLTQSRQEYPTT